MLAPEGLTVAAYLRDWLAHMQGRVRPKTLEGYTGLIRLYALPALGTQELRAVGPLDLQRLYAALSAPARGLSRGTVLNLHLVLTNALGQAERWGLIERNPATGAQPPRPDRPEPASIDRQLAERLLEAAVGTRFELPVTLALATGMRRGEILALRWSDCDAGLTVAHVRRTLQVTRDGLRFADPKTRRSRRAVELPAFVRPRLDGERHRQAALQGTEAWTDHDLICVRRDGRPVNPDTLSSGWYGFCRRRGCRRCGSTTSVTLMRR